MRGLNKTVRYITRGFFLLAPIALVILVVLLAIVALIFSIALFSRGDFINGLLCLILFVLGMAYFVGWADENC